MLKIRSYIPHLCPITEQCHHFYQGTLSAGRFPDKQGEWFNIHNVYIDQRAKIPDRYGFFHTNKLIVPKQDIKIQQLVVFN